MKGCEEEGRRKNARCKKGSRREGTGRRVGTMKELRLPTALPVPSSHLIPLWVRLPSFPFWLPPLSSPLHSLTLGIAPLSFSPLLFSPASSLAPLFSLMKVIANHFITKFLICTRNCRYELSIWFADCRQLAGTHLYSCIGFQCKRLVSLILASGNLGHTSN